ncbi:MAG: RloB family protein [Streptosporangiaceae bacterium]
MPGKDRRPKERSLRRQVAVRVPKRTFVIFCEGERTEPEYINALKLQPFVRDVAAVELRVQARNGGWKPHDLVEMAVSARERAKAKGEEVDEFWCVYDVEWPTNHPGLREAAEEARLNGVQIAVSNPCFEIWLILHFKPLYGAWLDSQQAVKTRRARDGSSDKAWIRRSTCHWSSMHAAALLCSTSGTNARAPVSRTTTRLLECTGFSRPSWDLLDK